MSHTQKCITVYERKPLWVPELQRQFLHDPVQVRQENSPQEALLLHGKDQNGLVILQLEAAPADCLRLLWNRMEAKLQIPVIVIHSQEFASLEWSVRELGVSEFLTDTVSGERLARIIRWITREQNRNKT